MRLQFTLVTASELGIMARFESLHAMSEEEELSGVNTAPSQESSLRRAEDEPEVCLATEELVTGSQKNRALSEPSSGDREDQAAIREVGDRAVLINHPHLSSLKRENFVRNKKPSSDSESSETSTSEGGGSTEQGRARVVQVGLYGDIPNYLNAIVIINRCRNHFRSAEFCLHHIGCLSQK